MFSMGVTRRTKLLLNDDRVYYNPFVSPTAEAMGHPAGRYIIHHSSFAILNSPRYMAPVSVAGSSRRVALIGKWSEG